MIPLEEAQLMEIITFLTEMAPTEEEYIRLRPVILMVLQGIDELERELREGVFNA